MAKINWPKLFGSLILTFSASWLGSYFTRPQIGTWYRNLQKTAITPPSWVFAPVWTILFLMMALAFYIIWNESNKCGTRKKARLLFYIQLAFNILWTLVFFNLHRVGLAIICIVVLIVAIIYCLSSFYRLNKTAGWLMFPYLIWTCYAALINISIFFANLK